MNRNPEKDCGLTPLRILHIINSLAPESGGPAESVTRLTQSATQAGIYDTEVVCLDDPSEPYLQGTCFPIHAIGRGLGKYGYSRKLDRWLKQNLDRFDGVVINGLWQYHAWAGSRACQGRVPYVVFPHGMLDPWFKRHYPIKHLKKALYWKIAEAGVLRHAEAVFFTASLEAELARQSFQSSEWTSKVVPYGTLPPIGDPSSQIEAFHAICPEVRGKRFIVFLGRLHEKKGCDLLVKAFARCAKEDPSIHLVLAGPDQQRSIADLSAIAGGLGVADRVHFPGMLRGDAKWGAFYAAEVFALPSHQENFGIAVAESLACGTPVLISNKVNIWREIVEDGVGIVDDDTIEGTSRMLRAWLNSTEPKKAAMAERCTATFHKRFHIQRLPRIVEEFFLQHANDRLQAAACLEIHPETVLEPKSS
jgi:glycosyltransferase involved in cell wall biosynthesis